MYSYYNAGTEHQRQSSVGIGSTSDRKSRIRRSTGESVVELEDNGSLNIKSSQNIQRIARQDTSKHINFSRKQLGHHRFGSASVTNFKNPPIRLMKSQ